MRERAGAPSLLLLAKGEGVLVAYLSRWYKGPQINPTGQTEREWGEA